MESGNLTSAAYAKIVKQAWSDPQFKAKLVADPAASLAAAGVPVPAGVTVKILEDTDKVMYLVLPPQPAANDLDDEALDLVVGGVAHVAQSVATAAMKV